MYYGKSTGHRQLREPRPKLVPSTELAVLRQSSQFPVIESCHPVSGPHTRSHGLHVCMGYLQVNALFGIVKNLAVNPLLRTSNISQ